MGSRDRVGFLRDESTLNDRKSGGEDWDWNEDQGEFREGDGDGGGQRERCCCNRTVMLGCPLLVVYQGDPDDSGLYCGQHVKWRLTLFRKDCEFDRTHYCLRAAVENGH